MMVCAACFAPVFPGFSHAVKISPSLPLNAGTLPGRFTIPISYAISVAEDMEGGTLVLEGILREEPERSALMLLAYTIYEEKNGRAYEQVLIRWRLKDDPKSAGPWAISDITEHDSVLRVMKR